MTSLVGPGYVHVYTGGGKGKTTASLGLALRAVGNGLKVLVIQFLKGPEMTGERKISARLAPELEIRSRGREGVFHPGDLTDEDREVAIQTLAEASRELKNGGWDLVILDEINTACTLGLVPVTRVVEIMDAKPDGVELVLTGRGAPGEVIEKADLVTEMREIKHYFRQGVAARKGIEK
jgi:cob(I)alamin adenosyltransferase